MDDPMHSSENSHSVRGKTAVRGCVSPKGSRRFFGASSTTTALEKIKGISPARAAAFRKMGIADVESSLDPPAEVRATLPASALDC